MFVRYSVSEFNFPIFLVLSCFFELVIPYNEVLLKSNEISIGMGGGRLGVQIPLFNLECPLIILLIFQTIFVAMKFTT